ncbi:MAG: hypothetical protein V7767_02015 [Leeuwenhoekiella sp.]
MKKYIILLLAVLGTTLIGCNPMDDIYDDLEPQLSDSSVQGIVDYTLSEDDYTALDLEANQSFNSLDDAKALIPALLDDVFPAFGNGSLVNATFNLYSPTTVEAYTVIDADYAGDEKYFSGISEVQNFLSGKYGEASEGDLVSLTYMVKVSEMSYELISEDYTYIGGELATAYPAQAANAGQYGNFERRESKDSYWTNDMILEALNVVLDNKYPDAAVGDKITVTYKIYDGASGTEDASLIKDASGDFILDVNASVSVIETTKVYSYINSDWNEPLTLEKEDYTAMGQTYPNFDDNDDVDYKIGIYLDNLFTYAEEGDYKTIGYAFYDGSTSTKYSNFIFKDGKFSLIRDVKESSLQFGNDGTTWIPDNTIKYTLTNADYEYIAGALASDPEYSGIVATLQNYHDYDSSWSTEQILYSLFVLAENNFPSAEIGQKYAMTYLVYSGGAAEFTANIILAEDGWKVQE